ncbi:MAG: alanine dehydrogenase [Blastococcus sp.]|jgi:alanine dehydrogenase|nr:alanine dehydrogenase [Blastococcus sp.]
MRVGVPTEVKDNEYRVAITPAGVHELVGRGHEVFVQAGAGLGSSLPDEDYARAGAKILDSAEEVWAQAELLLKVKEPVAAEYPLLRDDLVLFTYLHLAADRPLTHALAESGTTAIAYETVQLADRSLPLLAPMSEVAGRLAPQVGAATLMRAAGGRGVLVGGVSGVYAAKVVVLGAGVAGMNAAAIALGMQAEVLLLDTNIERLRAADRIYQGHLQTVASNTYEVERAVVDADLVIGAVLVPGAKAPVLVSDDLVARMKPGSVLVDIAIDQGGCFESSRPTTHSEPTYRVADSVFYCVANMPGAVPHTSTYALTNVTLPYVAAIADSGWASAVRRDPALAAGVNLVAGSVVSDPVAQAHGLATTALSSVLS